MAKAVDWESRIGRRLRLRDLFILSTVARCGSMAKAATQLRVTQPAVSKAIGDLEEAVGARLLDRSPLGIEPTVYGYALLKCSSAVFDELRQGVQALQNLADPSAGELRIGCQQTLAQTVLPHIIEQICRRHPRIDFDVTQLVSPNLEFPELRQRTLDFVLTRLAGPVTTEQLGEDLKVETLLDDRLFIVAGEKSPWVRRRKIELAELASEPWILRPPGSWQWQFMTEAFRQIGRSMPRPRVITYSVPLTHSLLASGKFITLMDGLTPRLEGKRLGVRPLPVDVPPWPWPIAIVMLKNRTVSPVVELFLKSVRSFVRDLGRHRQDS